MARPAATPNTDFTVDFDDLDSEGEISFGGGIINTEEQDYVYITSSWAADCFAGDIPTVEEDISWPGCLRALSSEAEGTYEVRLVIVPPEIDAASHISVYEGDSALLIADLGGTVGNYLRDVVQAKTACGDFFENPPGYAECE